MSDIQFVDFEVRAEANEKREITGIGVPWDQVVETYAGKEMFARGAVDDDGALLLYNHQHNEVVGRITDAKDTKAGREITGKIAQTVRGDEVLQLAKEGLLKLSIGFVPVEHQVREEETGTLIVRTRVKAKEYSLVAFPAYVGAEVTSVRSAEQIETEITERVTMTETITRADLDEIRTAVDTLGREVQMLHVDTPAPKMDTRSAGEVLKAIVAGDQETIDRYQQMHTRAYTGGTSADAIVKNGWVGDLTRIFDASSGVLASVFSTGSLPSTGLNIEYAQLKSNTVDVAAQAAEGDDIGFGKIAIETKTAPVVTYAGGTQLTRQEIERATVGVLNRSLEALAIAAGARKKAVLRTDFNALVAARRLIANDKGVVVLGAKSSAATATNWENALIDAALMFETINLPMDALVVNGMVFKHLRALVVTGERVFETWKDNASGQLNLIGLRGQLAGLPVLLDSGVANTAAHAVFVNGRAIRQYDSGLGAWVGIGVSGTRKVGGLAS